MNASSRRSALLLSNRHCRRCLTELDRCGEIFEGLGLKLIRCQTENPEDVSGCVERYRSRIDRVILAGGDGTLNVAAETIVRNDLPVGIVPMGTANDLARTLHIPSDLENACRIILEGKVHRIDLGSVNGKYFFNVAHIGLGVEVTRQLSRETKRSWGPFGYLKGLLSAYRNNRPFAVQITCNGRSETLSSIELAIGNGRHYGGFMTISEDAEIDDHILNLYNLKPQGFWRLASLASTIRKGRLEKAEGIWYTTGQEIQVKTDLSMPVVADGEFITQTPAVFRTHPEVFPVFVPQSYLG